MHKFEQDYCGLMVTTPGVQPGVKAQFTLFRRLSPEEYERYANAYGYILRAIDNDLASYSEESFRQLDMLKLSLRENIAKLNTSIAAFNVHSWHRTTQCSVLSFVSSIHLFYEQTKARIERLNPEALQHVEQQFRHEYDACFAYRLLFRLRNVMVHHSMNCVSLSLSSQEEKTPGGLIVHKHTVEFPLRRERFLETRQGVSAALREEIVNLPRDPDVYILAKEALACVKRISAETFASSHPDVQEMCRRILELKSLFDGQDGERALVRIPDFESSFKPGMQMPHTPLNTHIFQFAEKVMAAASGR